MVEFTFIFSGDRNARKVTEIDQSLGFQVEFDSFGIYQIFLVV